ncbi:MAG: DNA glycosylase AlkZ-like family protein, partial [Bacillota bacterium]
MARVSTFKISKKQARQFILTHQELLKSKEVVSKNNILDYINKVGCIQYDPLNKVGRNPHLVLQSRFKNYKKNYLKELLYKDRKLIDAWDKNMSIFQVEDWPYFKRNRVKAYNKYQKKKELVENVIPEVRKEIKNKGPLSSIDLDFDKKVDWSWAPTRAARAALESMYQWGELIIEHKVGTRKVYDFTDKYISENILSKEDPNKSQEDYHKWYIKRRIGSIGMLWDLSGSAWLGIKDFNKKKRVKAISSLIEQNELIEVKIKEIKHPVYIRQEELPLLNKIIEGVEYKPRVNFIAP